MARSAGAHVWTSRLRLGSNCLQRRSGCCCFVENTVHYNASKHIDVRYRFVWDCVISGKIGLEKICTTDNVVDGMTKCLSADRFRSLWHMVVRYVRYGTDTIRI